MAQTIEYDLSEADLQAFFEHQADHAPHALRQRRAVRWGWAGVLVVVSLVYAASSPTGALVFAAIGLAFLASSGRLLRWWYIRQTRRASGAPRPGRVRLELLDGRLLVEAPGASSRLDVSAIRRVDETDSHYFVYVGSVSALIVPKTGGGEADFVGALSGRPQPGC